MVLNLLVLVGVVTGYGLMVAMLRIERDEIDAWYIHKTRKILKKSHFTAFYVYV